MAIIWSKVFIYKEAVSLPWANLLSGTISIWFFAALISTKISDEATNKTPMPMNIFKENEFFLTDKKVNLMYAKKLHSPLKLVGVRK